LQTATVNIARYLRHSNEFGTVQIGKQADLVLLDGNPLVAISNTRRIAGVMVRGQWMPHAQLTSMMAEIPATYQRDLRLMKSELQSDPVAALKYLRENDPYLNVGQTAMSELAADEGFDQMAAIVRQLRVADPKSELVSEEGINKLGYNLVGEKKYKKAIAVFQMNTRDFPKSANAYDSLGETQFKDGDLPHALENYRKALETDPKYPNAKAAAKFLEDHNQQ
jgi:TolA-binding protein